MACWVRGLGYVSKETSPSVCVYLLIPGGILLNIGNGGKNSLNNWQIAFFVRKADKTLGGI